MRAAREGQALALSDGHYSRLSDPSGAEVWLRVGSDRLIHEIHPHFRGAASIRVKIDRRFEDSADTSRGFHATVPATKPGGAPVAFSFQAPDFRLRRGFLLPREASVQLAAFGDKVWFFEDEEAFVASVPAPERLPVETFERCDTCPPPRGRVGALLNGVIVECRQLHNRLSGFDFLWARVLVAGGEMDVVADPAHAKGLPRPGGIAMGHFWLSGLLR